MALYNLRRDVYDRIDRQLMNLEIVPISIQRDLEFREGYIWKKYNDYHYYFIPTIGKPGIILIEWNDPMAFFRIFDSRHRFENDNGRANKANRELHNIEIQSKKYKNALLENLSWMPPATQLPLVKIPKSFPGGNEFRKIAEKYSTKSRKTRKSRRRKN
jgi:hypothetical protein